MSFLWPPMLLALALVPLGVLVARAIERRRRRRAQALLGSLAGPATPAPGAGRGLRARGGRGLRARLPGALLVAAFAVLAVALARPQAAVSLPRVEGTVILLFDVSGSMSATDVQPTRMDVARTVARAIVERQPPGVVVGIVAFSDAGLTVQAPSSDLAAVVQAIDRLAPSRGTSLGQGIVAALDAIDRAEAATPPDYYSSRSPAPSLAPAPVAPGSDAGTVIVLLSDGENNERPDPLVAARAAADRGIRIETIGVGSAAGTTLDLDGFRVHTQLDEAALRQIAAVTAAGYHAADDEAGIAEVTDGLDLHLVLRSEPLEVTALVAALGVALLVAGALASFAWSGRLP